MIVSDTLPEVKPVSPTIMPTMTRGRLFHNPTASARREDPRPLAQDRSWRLSEGRFWALHVQR